jgi:hypothetical protein
MESKLIGGASTPAWDGSLMRALSRTDAPRTDNVCMTIGIENTEGDVYRIVKTTGLNETVRLFESARELGFGFAEGRLQDSPPLHRVLRRNDD